MLPYYFEVENLNYGQLVKLRDRNGRLVGKERRVIFGELDVGEIETTDVENFNGILREKLGRLVRRAKVYLEEEAAFVLCGKLLYVLLELCLADQKRKNAGHVGGFICENLDVT